MTTIYIGPYLVIPPAQLTSTARKRVCSNHCAKPAIERPAKFCSNCGGAVVDEAVVSEEVKPLPITKLDARWEDVMWRPEYGQRHPKGDIWLPNRGRIGTTYGHGSEDSYKPLALTDVDSHAMLTKAQNQYDAFVTALRHDFGIAPFWEVGVIAYAN
jgi:hypothetical protein